MNDDPVDAMYYALSGAYGKSLCKSCYDEHRTYELEDVHRAWNPPPPVDVDAEVAGLLELADQLAA